MDGLVHAGAVAKGSAGQQADGAGDGASFVTQNVAEDVVGQDNIKLLRVQH